MRCCNFSGQSTHVAPLDVGLDYHAPLHIVAANLRRPRFIGHLRHVPQRYPGAVGGLQCQALDRLDAVAVDFVQAHIDVVTLVAFELSALRRGADGSSSVAVVLKQTVRY